MIEKMIAKNVHYTGLADDVYAVTSSKSPHRKLAVDLAINVWDRDVFETLAMREFPEEFIVDILVIAGCKLRDEVEELCIPDFFANASPCACHEHTISGTPCYKTKRLS